jgi:hypothetical protein
LDDAIDCCDTAVDHVERSADRVSNVADVSEDKVDCANAAVDRVVGAGTRFYVSTDPTSRCVSLAERGALRASVSGRSGFFVVHGVLVGQGFRP